MSELFDCSIDNISLHLKNIFKEQELEPNSVIEDSSITANDGKKYKTKFYNLDAIISVGYRINSLRATQFIRWATSVLKTFTTAYNNRQIGKELGVHFTTIEESYNAAIKKIKKILKIF